MSHPYASVRFPHVRVKLIGCNGNAFAIMGNVRKALRRAGVAQDDIDSFLEDAMSGDYNHLLTVVQRTVVVE